MEAPPPPPPHEQWAGLEAFFGENGYCILRGVLRAPEVGSPLTEGPFPQLCASLLPTEAARPARGNGGFVHGSNLKFTGLAQNL